MPTYEYACSECGHQLEIFQSIRDERLTSCPACKKEGLKRLIGRGAGIIFKGSGFYQTDYKSGSGGEKKGGESSSTSSDSSASSSTPATPAAPASPAPTSNA